MPPPLSYSSDIRVQLRLSSCIRLECVHVPSVDWALFCGVAQIDESLSLSLAQKLRSLHRLKSSFIVGGVTHSIYSRMRVRCTSCSVSIAIASGEEVSSSFLPSEIVHPPVCMIAVRAEVGCNVVPCRPSYHGCSRHESTLSHPLKRGEGFKWPKPCSHRTLRELIRRRSLLSRHTIAL